MKENLASDDEWHNEVMTDDNNHDNDDGDGE